MTLLKRFIQVSHKIGIVDVPFSGQFPTLKFTFFGWISTTQPFHPWEIFLSIIFKWMLEVYKTIGPLY